MIARITLELALRKEFDYLVPPELAGQVEVGTRVQVPFGSRKVLGCVTAMAEESARTRLRPILKVIGATGLVTPKVLKLARWIRSDDALRTQDELLQEMMRELGFQRRGKNVVTRLTTAIIRSAAS